MDEEYDVEFIEHEDRAAKFLVRGVTPAFANGIRRAMIADVPTLAIDEVRFIENSSVMFDEQIALRLGLVPLSTPPNEFDEDDVVTLSLDVSGPGTAYSGDIRSSDEMVQPAEANVPIIELKDGQRLELEADAVLSDGKDHAKHQGGVSVGYRNLQRVEPVGDRGEFEDADPEIYRGVIEDDGELVDTAEFDHDITNRYPDREVEVTDVENAFVFSVETDGSMSVEELFARAVESLDVRAAELEDAVSL
ncbi:DNA-directed RNA polymerase subunit D [Halorubellus sp. JP-L1]|uniref:DNA-directed RNA polymerase subunit D n=1 Tax=Halorubellus sp. JP-L1 TaxID=2715753 RepID=UPI00140AB7D2|nr:DNA-directed RNA polymerase subunit D [Halorubellus sp. JP-L1]NHN40791.1 DNA-directed RNA polymerase subunit D [Halorubellus sp. JP-L1]